MSADGFPNQNGAIATRALWYAGERRAEIRAGAIATPDPNQALVRMLRSGVSRGTERLVFEGRVPRDAYQSMRAPMQEGEYPFPVKHGYCAVGVVEQGPSALVGRRVFALHPHQDFFVATADSLARIPDDVSTERAILAANMETALNALWDSGAGPGDRIAIFGGGPVGLLVCHLAARLPGANVILIDPAADRAAIVRSFGADFSTDPNDARDVDVAFHASATAAGLGAAIAACGLEAILVEMSWYGDRAVEAPLGGAFHSRRIRLVSSQVGHVSPARRPRWSHARRLAKALDLLADPVLDALIGERVAFDDLPAALPRLLAPGASGGMPIVIYP